MLESIAQKSGGMVDQAVHQKRKLVAAVSGCRLDETPTDCALLDQLYGVLVSQSSFRMGQYEAIVRVHGHVRSE